MLSSAASSLLTLLRFFDWSCRKVVICTTFPRVMKNPGIAQPSKQSRSVLMWLMRSKSFRHCRTMVESCTSHPGSWRSLGIALPHMLCRFAWLASYLATSFARVRSMVALGRWRLRTRRWVGTDLHRRLHTFSGMFGTAPCCTQRSRTTPTSSRLQARCLWARSRHRHPHLHPKLRPRSLQEHPLARCS